MQETTKQSEGEKVMKNLKTDLVLNIIVAKPIHISKRHIGTFK